MSAITASKPLVNSSTIRTGSNDIEHNSELLSTVLEKITLYRQKKWLSQEEEQDFLRVLMPKNVMNVQNEHQKVKSQISLDKATITVQNCLKMIQTQRKKEGLNLDEDVSVKGRTLRNIDESSSSSSDRQLQEYSKMHPKRKANKTSKFGNLSHEETQDLFVEMCFFARLSFMQPPSCLRCAYKDAKFSHKRKDCSLQKKDDTKLDCDKLVAWRVNADSKHLLHPNKLDGNIVIVKCSTVKAWLAGEIAEKMKWDRKTKTLIKV